MREPSASELALAQRCQHPWTSGIRWPEQEWNEFGDFGKRVHWALECELTGEHYAPAIYYELSFKEARALDRCVSHGRAEMARLFDAHMVDAGAVRAETVFRYDVQSGAARIAPTRFDRKAPGVWTMIADLVVVERDRVVVVDWKTGRQTNTAAARENPQVRLGAVAAARAFGKTRARVELIYLDEDGAWVDGAEFGRLELATIAHELRQLRATLTGGPTPPVPGMHCTQHYCKLAGICSATQSALATVQPVGERFSVEIRDDDHARWTLERLPGARKALEAVEKALKDHARTHPVPLADGKIYGWREASERKVRCDTPEREQALRDALGVYADVAIEKKTTITLASIEEACRRAADDAEEPRGKAKRMRAVVDALDAAGAIDTAKWMQCETFKPKEATP